MQDEKYQQKSKSISKAETNYFVHFAMGHPVLPFDPYSRFRQCNKEIEIITLLSVQFFCENARHEQLRH